MLATIYSNQKFKILFFLQVQRQFIYFIPNALKVLTFFITSGAIYLYRNEGSKGSKNVLQRQPQFIY